MPAEAGPCACGAGPGSVAHWTLHPNPPGLLLHMQLPGLRPGVTYSLGACYVLVTILRASQLLTHPHKPPGVCTVIPTAETAEAERVTDLLR